MKKIILIAILSFIASGCSKITDSINDNSSWTCHFRDTYTKIVEIDGHKYIILHGFDGAGIIHAASCPCNNH